MIHMNNSSIKETNLAAVKSYLLSHEGCTRVQIATDLGLSKMTISNIVNVLLEEGFVEEQNLPSSDSRGRPAKRLVVSSASPRIIGILLDYRKAKVVYSSLSGEVLSSTEIFSYETQETQFQNQILEEIDRIARESMSRSIYGFSVSVNGLVNGDTIENSQELFGIKNFSLLSEIKKRYSLPVYIDNAHYCDTSLEIRSGILQGKKEAIFLHVGKHIYGTMVHLGEILRFQGQEGEFGHISIDYNGLSCECGNRGCLETYASTTAMEKKLREITKLKTDFRGFCEQQAKKNDSRIDWALKDMMDKIAAALVGYINLMHPEIVVIGGDGVYLPDRYLAKLEKSWKEKTKDAHNTEVKKPKFKGSSTEAGVILPILQSIPNL